jgi:RNA polymerase sigma factor (sigma-70 family)
METCLTTWTNEELLLEYLTHKNNDAFALLYERLHGPMCSLAMELLGSWHDTDDIVQEAFQRLSKVREDQVIAVHSLAFKIVQNRALEKMRRDKRRRELQLEHLPAGENFSVSLEPDPCLLEDSDLQDKLPFRRGSKAREWFFNQEHWAALQAVLPRLKDRDRKLLEDRFIHRMTYRAMAERLHADRQYVSKLTRKAIHKVKELVQKHET